MPRTTTRLPDEAGARDAETAKRAALLDTAEARYARLMESGETIAWSEMRRYLEAKVRGKRAKRPVARELGRRT